MSKKTFSWKLFEKVPVVGIIRNLSLAQLTDILPVYSGSGLNTLEITMNTPGADELIRYTLKKSPADFNVGAGTVCTEDDLSKALKAGAQFIVTPITSKKIIKLCVKKGIPVFPGALTPTEIYKAWSLGASMVKLYPAKNLGPAYLKDIKAPLNQVKLLPTGGIDLSNMEAFREAGADGFGIGSPLFLKTLIDGKNWPALTEHFKKFVEMASHKN